MSARFTLHGLLVIALLVVLILLLATAWSRYRTALRLNRELRRYRAFVDHSRDLITVVDAQGILRFVSPASPALLGIEPADAVGREFASFVHPDDRSMIRAIWHDALASRGEVIDTPDYRLLRADGTAVFVQTKGRNLLHDDAVNGVLTHTHDVSERHAALSALRATEEQFRRAQRMEAVGRLAGGVAHDFNNVLTAIQGYTRLLLDEVPADSPMREDLEQVQHGAERAALLTRQLLAFSRRQMLRPQVLQLNDVVESLREPAERLLGGEVALDLDLAPDSGHVRSDAAQLEQVLTNLLMNARDATPAGGRVTVRTRRVTIDEEQAASYPYLVVPGEYAELTVSDEGPGIAPDVLPLIFEPFFTTKAFGQGNGLGLSTAYGIVKQSGGYIWVESEPGRGATFRVCLPSSDAVGTASTLPVEEPDRSIRGETILLIEDEEAVRRLATRILQRHGYHVIVAPDGRTALDICQGYSGPIELVMTDVVMPGLSGPDVVAQLRTTRPAMKALFVSGYPRDALMDEGGFLPHDVAFLEKPFSPSALTHKVREVLDEGQA